MSRDKHGGRKGRDLVDEILIRLGETEKAIRELQSGRRSFTDRVDKDSIPDPQEGREIIMPDDESRWRFSNGEWRPYAGEPHETPIIVVSTTTDFTVTPFGGSLDPFIVTDRIEWETEEQNTDTSVFELDGTDPSLINILVPGVYVGGCLFSWDFDGGPGYREHAVLIGSEIGWGTLVAAGDNTITVPAWGYLPTPGTSSATALNASGGGWDINVARMWIVRTGDP